MGGRFDNHVRDWRQLRGLTQAQVLDRLQDIAAALPPDEARLVPLTGASLSRIKNGKQNWTVGAMQAIARALEVDDYTRLLHSPAQGRVVSWFEQLDKRDAERAAAVLEAMFAKGGSAA